MDERERERERERKREREREKERKRERERVFTLSAVGKGQYVGDPSPHNGMRDLRLL